MDNNYITLTFTEDDHNLLTVAASLKGLSVEEFIINSTKELAQELLEEKGKEYE